MTGIILLRISAFTLQASKENVLDGNRLRTKCRPAEIFANEMLWNGDLFLHVYCTIVPCNYTLKNARRFGSNPLRTKSRHSRAFVLLTFTSPRKAADMKTPKPPSPFLTPKEEIAVDILFAYCGESRLNRTLDEYRAVALRLPRKLTALHSIVNEVLADPGKTSIEPYEICRFKAGDYGHYYEPFPKSLSFETVRRAWLKSGMRFLQLEGEKLSV